MSKDKYKRTNVHSDLLAKVIFRVDVAGLTDLTGYINRVKGLDLIKKSFKSYKNVILYIYGNEIR